MIHIIKEGTKKRVVCEICGCIFSYEAEDLMFKGQDGCAYYGIKEGYKKHVRCPQCGAIFSPEDATVFADEDVYRVNEDVSENEDDDLPFSKGR